MRFAILLLLPLLGMDVQSVPTHRMEVRGVTVARMHRGDTGYGSAAYKEQLVEIKNLDANWIALNDFGFMRDINLPDLRWGGERPRGDEDMREAIRDAHAAGLEVLVKPHLWSRGFGRDTWVGDIAMTNEADWATFFQQYTAYIVHSAKVAAEENADAFCIGVEMEGTTQRSADWRKLIAEVRKVYDGPVTYCAAFLEYEKIDWWDAVDVVGISAYFKLTDVLCADEAELRRGWSVVYDNLTKFHARTGKPIAFLELGYTESAMAGAEPWSYEVRDPDRTYQARLFNIAIDEASKHDFMVGVFIWKWFSGDIGDRYEGHESFLVQSRPEVREAIQTAWD